MSVPRQHLADLGDEVGFGDRALRLGTEFDVVGAVLGHLRQLEAGHEVAHHHLRADQFPTIILVVGETREHHLHLTD